MSLSLKAPAIRIAGPVLSLSLLATGCSTFSGWYGWSSIHKSARGSVYLQQVADWSFEADHPAVIDQATLLTAIQGILAEDVKNLSSNMPVGGSKPMRVFSDEDAEFLAPLLAQGLSHAKPDQIIGFTVSSSAGSGTEPAAGTIYRLKDFLYLTITPTKGRRISGFIPSAAARIERAPAYTADWTPGTLAMVINLHILGKARAPSGAAIAGEPNSFSDSGSPVAAFTKVTPPQDMTGNGLMNKDQDELQLAREANKMKDSEIAALKREVEWMRQELRERPTTAGTVSKRSSAKRKSAEAYPNR